MPTTTGIATEFIQFSRTSNATVTDSDGKIKWAPHNLLLNSESFNTASWTNDGKATVTANSVASPIGTTTADTLADTAITDIHYAYQLTGTGVLSGTPYTFGVFVRPNTLDYVTVGLTNASSGTDYAVAVFRLSTSTVQTTGVSGTGYSIVGTPTISAVGGGWYYCSVTVIPGTTRPFLAAIVGLNKTGIISGAAGGLQSYLGDGSSIYVWGAHLYRSDLAMQPNTSAYPLYNPTTPKNLLGFTESLTTGWTNTNTTDAIAAEVNPNNLTGAVDVAATAGNGTLLSSLSLLASPYTFSIWLKRKTGSGTVEITVDGTTYVAAAVTGAWTRFSTTLTPTAGTRTPGIRLVTSGDAVYAWGAQLSDSASLDPYFPSYSTAPTAAAYYGPRRDFDGSTLACKGLLVEESRTNALIRSSEFDSAAVWLLDAATVSPNVATEIAPDGTTSADKLVENLATSAHDIYQVVGTSQPIGTYTYSIYVKASGRTKFRLQQSASTSYGVLFDLTALTATTVVGGATGVITNAGNGWYRCAMTYTTVTAFAPLLVLFLANSAGSVSYAGDGTSGVLMWGAQLESGSFATSYLPTVATTFQRNVDTAIVSTQAFPYNTSEGTIVANVSSYGVFSFSSLVELNDGTINNRIGMRYNSASVASFLVINGGAAQATLNPSAPSASASKFAGAYKASDFAASYNGGTVSTSAIGSVPTSITKMDIGNYIAAANSQINGHIRQITYLPRRVTNAELQTRTA